MQLRNCVECGKVFAHASRKVCQDCYDQEERDFDAVHEFLWKKKDSTIEEIHEATGVAEKKITKFIREGRIGGKGLNVQVSCDACGGPVSDGRYCAKCRERLVSGLSDKPKPRPAQQPTRKSSSADKMFIADRRGKN